MHKIRPLFLFLFIFISFTPAWGEEGLEDMVRSMKVQMDRMQVQLKDLTEKVQQQEQDKKQYEERIRELQGQLSQQQQATKDMQAASVSTPVPAGKPKWLPDIGVLADIVYKQDTAKEDEEGADRVSAREVELILGSEVDPYTRLDATVSFSDFEEASLEEAYVTRFGLPFDAKARLGKFKPNIGKAIPMHRDSLDTVDEPLVIQKYFGAEGFNKAGADLMKIFDAPWPVTHQVSVGILEGGNGEEGTAFGEVRRRPTAYSHLKNYVDLGEATGFELGASHMIGSRDDDSRMEVQILAADATLTHQLNPQQSLKLQGEVFNMQRQESMIEFIEEDDTVTLRDVDGTLWGSYGLLDFRFHPQWSAGFRYDYVEPVDNDRLINPEKAETGYTGYLTFYQSEFARWRAQLTHTNLITGKEDNAFMLQGTFAIGEHKHKIQ